MIKLNMYRFDDSETISVNLVSHADTSGVVKFTGSVKDARNMLEDLNKTGITINPSSIDSSIKKLDYLQNLLKTLKANPQVDMKSAMGALKDFNVFGTLPKNVQKLISNIGDIQTGIKSNADYETLLTSLSGVSTVFKSLSTAVAENSGVLEENVKSNQDCSESLKDTSNEAKNTGNSFKDLLDKMHSMPNVIDKVSKAFNKMDFTKLVNLWRTVRRITSGLVSAVESAAGYEESLNLYTMALGKYANEAKVWSEMITTKLKLDPSQVMQYTGAFYNLLKGMKVGADDAYLMSKNLTQLTYDMASYLNISNEAAQAKIQSAMAGQSRAVASVGVATQVASLQELAYSMNIKKKVSQMTQAEKTYLRYIQLMKSTEQMQGDLGRTMITPANAMRTLKNQVALLGRAIGQVLTPIIMQAIPYIMALTNVLTRLASTLAGKLGYSITDINYDKALSFETAEDGVNNLNDLAGAAAKAGKSVQNSLAPFDELNVVMSESSGVGAGVGGLGDVIDGSIWSKALPQYDMLKDYTGDLVKKAEALEGKVTAIVGIVTGFIAAGAMIKLVNFAKDLYDTFKSISQFGNFLDVKLGQGASALLTAAQAVLLALASSKLAEDAVQNAAAGNGATSDWEVVGSQAAGMAAGATVGAKVGGPVGAVVGMAVGETYSIIKILTKSNDLIEKNFALYRIGLGEYNYEYSKTLSLIDQFNEKYETSRQLIVKSANAKLEDINYYDILYDRLGKITDENGKILKGHEMEADIVVNELNTALGTNIKIRNGEVEEAKKAKKAVEDIIKSKKAEIKLEAMYETYKQAILNESKALKSLRDAEDAVRAAKELVNKASSEGAEAQEEAQKKYDEAYEKYMTNYNNYKTIIVDKKRYEDAMVAYTKKDYDEINEIYDKSYERQCQTLEDAMIKMTNELNGGQLSEDMITAWRNLAKNYVLTFNSALEKIADEDTKNKIIDAVGDLYNPITANIIKSVKGGITGMLDTITSFVNNTPTKLKFDVDHPENLVTQIKNALAKKSIGVNVEATGNSGNILSNLLSGVTNFAKNVLKFKFAATGGMLDSGDLFFANENGVPEYITSVGNKSAVINQNQMVQTLTNAITAGFQQFGGNRASNVTVYVGDKKLYEGQGEYQNRQNDRYGTTVVRI